jgi:hypothetical protein
MQLNGALQQKRKEQELILFEQLLLETLQMQFFSKSLNKEKYLSLKQAIQQGELLAFEACSALFATIQTD